LKTASIAGKKAIKELKLVKSPTANTRLKAVALSVIELPNLGSGRGSNRELTPETVTRAYRGL